MSRLTTSGPSPGPPSLCHWACELERRTEPPQRVCWLPEWVVQRLWTRKGPGERGRTTTSAILGEVKNGRFCCGTPGASSFHPLAGSWLSGPPKEPSSSTLHLLGLPPHFQTKGLHDSEPLRPSKWLVVRTPNSQVNSENPFKTDSSVG